MLERKRGDCLQYVSAAAHPTHINPRQYLFPPNGIEGRSLSCSVYQALVRGVVLVCYGLGVQPPLLNHCYLELLMNKSIDINNIHKGDVRTTNMTQPRADPEARQNHLQNGTKPAGFVLSPKSETYDEMFARLSAIAESNEGDE